MGWYREGVNAQVREMVIKKLNSPQIKFQPVLAYFGLAGVENRQKLGTPNTRTVIGNAGLSKDQLEVAANAPIREVKFQQNEPNDGGTVTYDTLTTPTASQFAEDNVGTAAFKYTIFMEPLKMRVASLDAAQSETAVGAVVDESMDPVFNRFVKRVASGMWAGTLTAAQQAKQEWTSLLGLSHVLTANNVYGTVDRSDKTVLNPVAIVAGTSLPTNVVDLNLNRTVNLGYTDQTTSVVTGGLAGRDPKGVGCNLFITTPGLWADLADQAESRHLYTQATKPDHFLAGMDRPWLEHDNVTYVWDDSCPSGTMIGLNLWSWLIEVHKKYNFQFTGLVPKWKTEEGGEMYEWGQFVAKMRMICTAPWLQCGITGLVDHNGNG